MKSTLRTGRREGAAALALAAFFAAGSVAAAKGPEVELPRPSPPDGEKVLRLSIERAVMMALESNKDLRVRRLAPVIAGTFEEIERAAYDPELFVEAEYFKEKAEESSRATGEQFAVERSDTDLVAGIRRPLPSGTTLEASVEQSRSTSNRAPDQQEARIGLSLTQALLRGRGSPVNLARVRQAELASAASIHELRAFTEALVANVERAYWNFVLADREIEIFERSLEVARKQKNDVEEQIGVGLLAEIEAAAARAEVARREQGLALAESLREERRLELLRLLGREPGKGSEPSIHPSTDPQIEAEPVDDVADRLRLADRSRPDLAEARLRLEQERLETVVTRNGLLPKLDLFIALGGTGYAESFSGSFGELGGDTYDFRAGIRFSRLLGNRSARARDRAAHASRRQAAVAVENLEDLVNYDVRLAVTRLESARRQIAASLETKIFEEQTLSAEQERFAVGAGTSLLVAQAQRDLLASQIAEIRSIINYRIARTELFRSEGSLLERRGVQLLAEDE